MSSIFRHRRGTGPSTGRTRQAGTAGSARRAGTAGIAALTLLVSGCSSSDDGAASSPSAGGAAAAGAGSAGSGAAGSGPAGSGAGGGDSTGSGAAGSGAAGAAGGGSAMPDCKVGADGALQYYTDKAAWKPDLESMNATSQDNCGLSVAVTGYSDPTQYNAFIMQGFQTDQKPTLFTWHTGDQLKSLVDKGLVAETTDIWKAATAAGYVPDGLIDNYTYGGKQYCVPLNIAYWVMYYNKKSFADAGVTPPKTWDEFTKVTAALRAKGQTPLHQMNVIFSFAWFQALLMGGDPAAYAGLETGKTKYTDAPVQNTMKQWYQMEQNKDFIDAGVQTDPQTLLKTGKVAMAYFGTFFTGQLTSVGMKSDSDYGVFALPNVAGGKQQMALETGPLCVGARSANEKAALAYSSWWMGVPAQTAWSDKRGDISFNPQVPVKDPALGGLLKDLPQWQIHKRWLEATPTPIYNVADPAFGEFVSKPTADSMPMLQKIQAAADQYWNSQG